MKTKLLLFLLLVYFLFLRFQLGTVRYFNVDEFAHLHWGYSLLAGEKPYTDFFYLFPPFFLYPVAAIFSLFGRTINAVIAVRLFIFLVFLANLGLVFLLGKKLRSIFVGLLAAFIFVILPIPADNMVEVRPDNLATLFSLLGLYLFMLGLEKKKKQYFFLSGLSFAGSLGFVPKTVFFLIPPLLILGYRFLINSRVLSLGYPTPRFKISRRVGFKASEARCGKPSLASPVCEVLVVSIICSKK